MYDWVSINVVQTAIRQRMLQTDILFLHLLVMVHLLLVEDSGIVRTVFSRVLSILTLPLKLFPKQHHLQALFIMKRWEKWSEIPAILLHFCSFSSPHISSHYIIWHCHYQICGICFNNPKDMAFGCGHQVT